MASTGTVIPLDPVIAEQERRCISSLVEFRREFLAAPDDVEAAPFHHKWSRELLFGRGHYAAEGFRESAKDQYITQAFLKYCLTYPCYDRSYLLFIGPTITSAASKIREITKDWLSPHNIRLNIGVTRVSINREDVFEVEYDSGIRVRIESFGRGSALRGAVWGTKRPDIVIMNDVQDRADMYSPDVMEKDWKWFVSDVKMLGYTSRIFIIGNNLGKSCLIERVADNARSLGFKFERFPMLLPDGSSSWPARYPAEVCVAERESFREMGEIDTWERERMCVAMSEESRPLKVEDLRYYNEYDFDYSSAAIVTVVDPAISEKLDADPSVILTVAIMSEGWYVLDVDRSRCNPSEQVDDIFRAAARWNPQAVGIETVAYQESLAHYVEKKQKETGIFFNIVRIKTSKNKIQKIRGRLQPMLRAGAIFLPEHAAWRKDFEDEIREFPTAAHDDCIDALSMVEDSRSVRLIDSFISRTCVCGNIPIPVSWPFWCGLSASPEGEAILLFVSVSPQGALYVTDEIFMQGTPEELYVRYKSVLGGRIPVLFAASDEMFRGANKVSGDVWVQSYIKAGFVPVPAQCDFKSMISALNQRFVSVDGARPELQVFSRCKRLCWELYNACAGEQNDPNRKGIQALMNVLACGPRWMERSGAREEIVYPDRDVY